MKPSWIEKVNWIKKDERISVQGSVPQSAEFFQDHFPDFPVLPGVLMLEILKQTAERYLQSRDGLPKLARSHLLEVQNAKFAHFLKPGDEWQSHLELLNQSENQIACRGTLSSKDRIAASAKLIFEFVPEAEASAAAREGG